MRTILIICLLTLVGGGYLGWRAMRMPTQFGAFTGAPKVAVADLVEKPKDFLGKLVSVEGTITDQCKTMGCFFFIHTGKENLRIDLQEIAMTAPMNEGGKGRVEGMLVPYGDTYQLNATAIEFK